MSVVAEDWALMPMQWRGSDDAVIWSAWEILPALDAKVVPFAFYQVRVWRDGRWRTSQIGCDP
jgi:hypothetical protein